MAEATASSTAEGDEEVERGVAGVGSGFTFVGGGGVDVAGAVDALGVIFLRRTTLAVGGEDDAEPPPERLAIILWYSAVCSPGG